MIASDPKSKNRKLYGTLDILEVANQVGLMPTRNFSQGSFEHAGDLTGPSFSALVAKRGGIGRSGTPCVPGCTIQCSNVLADKTGEKKIVASLQYESMVLLGPNLGIGDVDTIGELNNLCNEVGVDTIETGAALGVAMEAGVAEFGDGEAARNMIRQIGEGTYLGRILGNGASFTGQAFGIRRVPTLKGQAMPGYDPRPLRGMVSCMQPLRWVPIIQPGMLSKPFARMIPWGKRIRFRIRGSFKSALPFWIQWESVFLSARHL